MSVNAGNVTGSGATQSYYQNLNTKKTGGREAAPEKGGAAEDQYTAAGTGAPKGLYSKDSATMQKLWSMAEARHASMRGMVESLLGGTGGHNGQAFWAMAANGQGQSLNHGKLENFRVDEATQAKAQEMIGEDGYFGVKKTTERIMDFAKALAGAGANEKTIENLKKGVQAGFDSVADLFGGFDKLPQVTKDTYDAVMKEFESWTGGTKLAGG